MADKIKASPATPVRALDHTGDTRTNIPTAELESFVTDDERRPTIVRYPRDPSLDPQLVWKGKDEQDGHDLEAIRSRSSRTSGHRAKAGGPSSSLGSSGRTQA